MRQRGSNVSQQQRTNTKQHPQNGCPDSLMSSNLNHERIILQDSIFYRTGTQIADEMMKRVSTPCSTLQVIDVVGTVKTIWNEARTKFRLKYTVTCTQ